MRKFRRTSHIETIEQPNDKKISILLLFGLIVLGIIIGTITFCTIPDNELLMNGLFNHGFIKIDSGQTMVDNFLIAFRNTSFLIVILFILGFGAVSQPIEAFVPFYRGVALGISVSFTYLQYGFKGFLVALLIILPHAVGSSIILILATRESIKSSNMFAGFAFVGRDSEKPNPQIKFYFIKFLVLLVLLMISSILDSVLSRAFQEII